MVLIALSTFVIWCCGIVVAGLLLLHRILTPPRAIRHLPCVPIFPLLRSYFLHEPDDVRFQRLIMPFANEKGEGVVVVWAFGIWMIHIVDHKLFVQVSTMLHAFPKAQVTPGTIFHRFLGASYVFQASGVEWKKQSIHVQAALAQPLPIDHFASLARTTFGVIEATDTSESATFTVRWSEIAQKLALDAVGISIIGHHFNALRIRSPFLVDYHQIIHDIAEPAYLAFPVLERLFPRRKIMTRVDRLLQKFQELIDAKRTDPGSDIMTFLLKDPEMSRSSLVHNMAILFVAGHDTTSGAMSALVYYLAVNRHIQSKARDEVLCVLGPTNDPSVALTNAQSMPYLNACVREALRINPPASYLVPRVSHTDFMLGKYLIPAGSWLVCNIYGVHHGQSAWTDPDIFRPERFLEGNKRQPWLPFSVGPRQCPGRNFAQYEIRTLVAMLLQRYEWYLPEGSIHAEGVKNAFSLFALLLPKDLDITFKLLNGQTSM